MSVGAPLSPLLSGVSLKDGASAGFVQMEESAPELKVQPPAALSDAAVFSLRKVGPTALAASRRAIFSDRSRAFSVLSVFLR